MAQFQDTVVNPGLGFRIVKQDPGFKGDPTTVMEVDGETGDVSLTGAVTIDGLILAGGSKEAYEMANPALVAQGILAETAPPTTQAAIIDGTIYFMGVQLHAGQVVSRISIGISTAGNGTSLSKVGLYDASGNRLARSADQASAWDTAGLKNIDMITPYTIPTSGWYYVAFVAKTATTMPTPVVSIATSSVVLGAIGPFNGGSTLKWGVQTGQTDLPATATIVAGAAPKVLWAVVT